MKALVTGATGFVGSHLAEALRRRGDEVTALARSASKAAALAPLGVRVVPGDLHDRGGARAGGRRARTSSTTSPASSPPGARPSSWRPTATAPRNVVDGGRARRASGRLVFVSSMAAAGPTHQGPARSGATSPRGRSPPTAGASSPPSSVVTGSRSALDHRPAADGLRPARPGSAQGVPAGPARRRAGARRRHPGALGGARRRSGGGAGRRRHRRRGRRPDVLRLPPRGLHRRRDGARASASAMGKSPAVIRGARHDRPRRAQASPRRPRGSPARPPSSPPTRPTSSSSRPGPATPAPLTRDTGWRAARDLRTGLAETYQWYRTRRMAVAVQPSAPCAAASRSAGSCRWIVCCWPIWHRLGGGGPSGAVAARLLVAGRWPTGSRPLLVALLSRARARARGARCCARSIPCSSSSASTAQLDVLNARRGAGPRRAGAALGAGAVRRRR